MNSTTPSGISPETKYLMETIEQVSESRINSYRLTDTPIKEVSEEECNEESSKMEEEEVEEVMEVADFRPSGQNRSFGGTGSKGSMIEWDKGSEVVEKISFDIPTEQHKRVLRKSSL
jgi:hypothetical protein